MDTSKRFEVQDDFFDWCDDNLSPISSPTRSPVKTMALDAFEDKENC